MAGGYWKNSAGTLARYLLDVVALYSLISALSVSEAASDPLKINLVQHVSEKDALVPLLHGFHIEWEDGKFVAPRVDLENGMALAAAGTNLTVRLFGRNFSPRMRIGFSADPKNCTVVREFAVDPASMSDGVAVVVLSLELPQNEKASEIQHVCLSSGEESTWHHQGEAAWVTLRVDRKPLNPYILPIWLEITVMAVLLVLSGLFSGLNLGLMTLDPTELKIIQNCGAPTERRYAKSILPLRRKGNFLLCTLILGNVLVNSTLTIFMDDMTSGLVAIIGSTIAIVIFGEIIPQALCSRHGMAIGAHTIWITRFFMLVTFPLSWPISKLLDFVLGAEVGLEYNRDKLMELIRITHHDTNLEEDEVNIIAGALEMKKKTAEDIMVELDEVFMLPVDAELSYDSFSEIMRKVLTQIPVYDGERSNIVALVGMKNLVYASIKGNTSIRTLCWPDTQRMMNVPDDTTLDLILDRFRQTHSDITMALVQRISDGKFQTIGVVTLDDVIQDMMQLEFNIPKRREVEKLVEQVEGYALFDERSVSDDRSLFVDQTDEKTLPV